QQAALLVEEQAVGAGVLAVDLRLAVAVQPHDVAVAAGQDAELGVPRRPLAAGAFTGLGLKRRALLEDGIALVLVGRRHRGDDEPHAHGNVHDMTHGRTLRALTVFSLPRGRSDTRAMPRRSRRTPGRCARPPPSPRRAPCRRAPTRPWPA